MNQNKELKQLKKEMNYYKLNNIQNKIIYILHEEFLIDIKMKINVKYLKKFI